MTSQPDLPATDSPATDEDGTEALHELPSDYRATGASAVTGGTDRTSGSDAAADPDLVIVAEELTHEDPDGDDLDGNDLGRDDLGRHDLGRDDLGRHDLGRHDLGRHDLADDDLNDADLNDADLNDVSDDPGLATAVATGLTGLTGEPQTGGNGQLADVGQEWHDIQALFVDDPRGSVELAAAAAAAAVSALVQTLEQRQAALAPSGSASAEPGDTEQLREALRSYRIFCQSLTDVGQRLAQPAAMAQ
jgi:hypothetical protein